MLSVLAFKKSLFAGVLDGGDSEIFMHGTRLSQFMDSVEEVTQTMGQCEPQAEASEPAPARPAGNADSESDAPGVVAPAASLPDPWGPLIDVGMQLVAALGQATDADSSKRPAWIETDSATGKSFIKLPVPDPQTVQRLAGAIGDMITRLRN